MIDSEIEKKPKRDSVRHKKRLESESDIEKQDTHTKKSEAGRKGAKNDKWTKGRLMKSKKQKTNRQQDERKGKKARKAERRK